MSDEFKPGEVRKDLYAYLEAEGFEVTEPRHRAIRTAMILHTNTANAAERRDRQNALDSLRNVNISSKMSAMLHRIMTGRCPACGLEMKKLENGRTLAECGHLPGISIEKV